MASSTSVSKSTGNSGKGSPTVSLSSNVDTLADNGVGKLTFTFSDKPVGFSLDDIKVTNGTVTNLIQDSTNPNIYTASFIGGLNEKSMMSTIKLDGAYTNVLGTDGTPSNAVTIKNLETKITPTVSFSTNNTTIAEGNAGITKDNFTVYLSAPVTDPVTVFYSTEAQAYGSAKANSDYVPVTSSVTFAPGETSKTISVDVIGDTVYEPNEYFYLSLTSATGATVSKTANWIMANIKNDDLSALPTVGFSSNNATITEGNAGFTPFNFTFSLSQASKEAVAVSYSTEALSGSAQANKDYIPASGNVTFAPGETSKTITVNVIGDTVYEGNEYFYMYLTKATGATLGLGDALSGKGSWMMGNIKNDDTAPLPTVGFTTNNTSINEGNSGNTSFNLSLSLSSSSKTPVTVSYSTEALSGSAEANKDYLPAIGTVTFAPGETSKTITVNVIGDTVVEGNEYFYLNLTSATGATIGLGDAVGGRGGWIMANIKNDDLNAVKLGIVGTTDRDTLGGKSGDDYIDGKGGPDILTGYAGSDTFVFAKSYGAKTVDAAAQVMDFGHGVDHIGLQGDLTFSGIKVGQGTGAHASDTIVSLTSGDVLAVLVGVNAATLNAADFNQVT